MARSSGGGGGGSAGGAQPFVWVAAAALTTTDCGARVSGAPDGSSPEDGRLYPEMEVHKKPDAPPSCIGQQGPLEQPHQEIEGMYPVEGCAFELHVEPHFQLGPDGKAPPRMLGSTTAGMA